MSITSFSELPISPEVLRAIGDMGFEEATPIQAESIPHILEGRDILGQAQTGTGKTCAFGIPIIERVDQEDSHIQYLILSPTRELAMQIADELHDVTKYKEGVRILSVYGGQSIDRQILALKKKPQIIVGTPGRVMDHMRRKTIRLENLRGIILDEADEMLNMGFKEDIDTILESTPERIQKVFFSATMPRPIAELTDKYLVDPIHVRITPKQLTVANIEQFYIEVREANKIEVLCRLIEAEQIKLALVFCNMKRRVDELTEKLLTRGYAVEALHGDMKQMSRTRVMNRFKKGEIDLLVATDVAARGIDVDDIEVVINYDLPQDEEYYVHRIGRTGRAGKGGKSYTFVVGREIFDLKNIQHYTKSTIKVAQPPTLMDVTESRVGSILSEIKDQLEQGELDMYANYVEKFVDGLNVTSPSDVFYTTVDVAAAMLRRAMGESFATATEIEPVVPYQEMIARRNAARRQPQGERLSAAQGSSGFLGAGSTSAPVVRKKTAKTAGAVGASAVDAIAGATTSAAGGATGASGAGEVAVASAADGVVARAVAKKVTKKSSSASKATVAPAGFDKDYDAEADDDAYFGYTEENSAGVIASANFSDDENALKTYLAAPVAGFDDSSDDEGGENDLDENGDDDGNDDGNDDGFEPKVLSHELREPREPRAKSRGGKRLEPGMARLFLNVGTDDKVQPKHIVSSVCTHSNLKGFQIGAIAIYDRYAFVDVPEAAADMVVESLNNKKVAGRVVRVEKSAGPGAGPDGTGGGVKGGGWRSSGDRVDRSYERRDDRGSERGAGRSFERRDNRGPERGTGRSFERREDRGPERGTGRSFERSDDRAARDSGKPASSGFNERKGGYVKGGRFDKTAGSGSIGSAGRTSGAGGFERSGSAGGHGNVGGHGSARTAQDDRGFKGSKSAQPAKRAWPSKGPKKFDGPKATDSFKKFKKKD